MDTDSPVRRIFWEQALQPWQLRDYELYHALAFAAPLILPTPMVVTVYDLSFLRYPAGLSAARRLYLRAMTTITCTRARRVLAISQSTADDLTTLLGVPASKIDVTPLGYEYGGVPDPCSPPKSRISATNIICRNASGYFWVRWSRAKICRYCCAPTRACRGPNACR